MPGTYRYVVRAEGYVPAEGAFAVDAEPLFIPVALVEEAGADDALMDALPDGITSWQELQTRLDEAESGALIQLSQHLTADVDSGDTALIIPAGKTITLDLNGFTLDRGLDWPEPDGSAIIVEGTFTLEDSVGTGTITGGYADEKGGGVYVAATFKISGGSVIENKYEDVYLTYHLGLEKSPKIGQIMVAPGERNRKNDFISASDDLQCDAPFSLKVDDELMEDDRLWLITCPGSDLELNQRLLACFDVSDADDGEQSNVLSLDDEDFGLIYFSRQCYVRLRTGVGSDETLSIPVGYGNLYTLPTESPFDEPPEHLTLIGRRMGYVREDGNSDRELDESIMIEGDRTVTARWLMDWAGLKALIRNAQDGDTIALPCDVRRGEDWGEWLEVPRGSR